MTSSHHGLYVQGYTRTTVPVTMGSEAARWSKSQQRQAWFGLWAAIRPHEAGIASNRRSACCGEYVLGSCTHRPSSHGSRQYPKFRDGGIKVGSVTGAKS